MAQNSQAQKPKWAMGNFFQQAVAGVESRLDNILLDQDETPNPPTTRPENNESAPPVTRSPAGCTDILQINQLLRLR